MKLPILAVAGAVLALPLIYLGVVALVASHHGYGWSEMDWNSNGRTSLSEFLATADIGKRQVIKGSTRCQEYFAYKDGMPVRTDCPAT